VNRVESQHPGPHPNVPPHIAQTDTTDGILAAVAEIWPGTDTRSHGVVVRLARALSLVSSDLEAVADDFAISLASLEALTMLRLVPSPHRLSQRTLGELLMRTSGTLSVRLARLEQAGMVTREPDPYDARGVIVELTARGRKLVDDALAARVQTEARLLSVLTRDEQDELCALLGKLLVSLEQREAGPRLGIEVATRRAAKEIRNAHGIAAGVGLLVAAVDEGGLAARAGIAAGDLIVRMDGHQLRSAAQLKRAVLELGNRDKLDLTVLRAGKPRQVTVAAAGA
jgi:DNA-binding MarR family transcriptional regulator